MPACMLFTYMFLCASFYTAVMPIMQENCDCQPSPNNAIPTCNTTHCNGTIGYFAFRCVYNYDLHDASKINIDIETDDRITLYIIRGNSIHDSTLGKKIQWEPCTIPGDKLSIDYEDPRTPTCVKKFNVQFVADNDLQLDYPCKLGSRTNITWYVLAAFFISICIIIMVAAVAHRRWHNHGTIPYYAHAIAYYPPN